MARAKREKKEISLKWGLLGTVLICWVIPIVATVVVAGVLLSNSYERNLRETVDSGVERAMEQANMRCAAALESSKAVSYDGNVRTAYRDYLKDNDQQNLYNTVTDYLSQNFSRDVNFKGVFLTFLDRPEKLYSCVSSYRAPSYSVLQHYKSVVQPLALELMESVDTGIYFLQDEGEVYMVRNLLDSQFSPYAVLVMLCDTDVLFQSFSAVASVTQIQIALDDISCNLLEDERQTPSQDAKEVLTQRTVEFSGHTLTVTVKVEELRLWGAMPELRWAIALILLLGIPFLLVVIWMFYRYVAHPVETLVRATGRVEAGERGYVIEQLPSSLEFGKLTRHFNSMSTELKSQFERLYLEQQSLQQARIKALQSQINPHFLGNTLETINWEARIAQNDKISGMIEALGTMLDAATNRDGRSEIPLREELGYVDAYLYISKQRLGERLHVCKLIDKNLEGALIPRLAMQPLVENAIEYDVSGRRESELLLRVYAKEQVLYLEIEHDGAISAADEQKILRSLESTASPNEGGHVGIRNVSQRLKLLYGDGGGLSIRQIGPARILAQVYLPLCVESGNDKQETTSAALI